MSGRKRFFFNNEAQAEVPYEPIHKCKVFTKLGIKLN